MSIYFSNVVLFYTNGEIEFVILDIDDCVPVVCHHGATCDDLLNDYKCNCVPGYTGKLCQTGKS